MSLPNNMLGNDNDTIHVLLRDICAKPIGAGGLRSLALDGNIGIPLEGDKILAKYLKRGQCSYV